jgi:pentapeptide MXKDX repeat protein
MLSKVKVVMALASLAFTFALQTSSPAQDSMKHEDGMQQNDNMKHADAMPQENSGKALETGTFHGKVHSTSGRATIYRGEDGKLILRLDRRILGQSAQNATLRQDSSFPLSC